MSAMCDKAIYPSDLCKDPLPIDDRTTCAEVAHTRSTPCTHGLDIIIKFSHWRSPYLYPGYPEYRTLIVIIISLLSVTCSWFVPPTTTIAGYRPTVQKTGTLFFFSSKKHDQRVGIGFAGAPLHMRTSCGW